MPRLVPFAHPLPGVERCALPAMLAQLAGHEERDLEALRSIKAFIDDSVTTLRDHKVRCVLCRGVLRPGVL